jgi:CRP-like cAMP-binding protein
MIVPLHLNAGEVLIREGEQSDCMYILRKGALTVSKSKQGVPTDIGVVKAGETVGEISFLDQRPRSATVKAQTASELVMINRPHFEAQLAQSPELIQNILKAMAERIRKTDEKIVY